MKESASVFGNTLGFRARCGTGISYHLCRMLFKNRNNSVDLAAVARGGVYDDFGVLTIVNRNAPEYVKRPDLLSINPKNAVIIGTIRMGFGHWRIAIALASAAHSLGYTPYLLDLMSFSGTTAAASIKFLEYWYNKASRISQSWSWFNSHIWEKMTSQGGQSLAACLREQRLASLFAPVLQGLPHDMPFMSAHPWVGHAAIKAGLTNVTSVIPDNLPMAFWLVENSRHTVQSPSAYMGYRTLLNMECRYNTIEHCVDSSALYWTGNYVDYEIASNIDHDCGARLERMAAGEPRRFLLTMGGAGAQIQYFTDIAMHCIPAVQQEKACLLINMGDHEGRCSALRAQLDKNSIPYTFHDDWAETRRFAAAAWTEHLCGIHVFLHHDFYAAVYATNLLMRVSDILVTKPSELAYYPVPKLFIHRVGRHEAWGAIRGSEIGDGTMETDTNAALHRTLDILINEDDLLRLYCTCIMNNNQGGLYNGAYNAVKLAASPSFADASLIK